MAARAMGPAALPPVRIGIAPARSRPLRLKSKARDVIEDELDDVFFGIDNAWQPIRDASTTERDDLRNDKVIERGIRRRASEMDLLKTYLLLSFGNENKFPAYYRDFLDATDRLGTDEARIYGILRGVSQAERTKMQQMPGFVEVIEDEMSGGELREAWRLLYEREQNTGTATSSVRSSTKLEIGKRFQLDAEARTSFSNVLYNAKEAAFLSAAERQAILDDSSLWAVFADEFGAEEVWYLRMILRYGGTKEFPVADTQSETIIGIIWDSVEGAGTKNTKLITGLGDVNRAKAWSSGGGGRTPKSPPRQELLDDPWFYPMLDSELSKGELKQALGALTASAPATSGSRKALVDAIGDRDLEAIRKLLVDPKLPAADLASLRSDSEVLEKMGAKLSGAVLCETTQLLHHGSAGIPKLVEGLLVPFRKDPIDVTAAVTYLKGLSAGDQVAIRREPGVHVMVVRSGLSYADRAKVLAALRSHDRHWQEPGSEGTHTTTTANMRTKMQMSFTSSEARIKPRLNLDTHLVPKKDGKPFRVDSGVVEDWTRSIDEVWNDRFDVKSQNTTLALVFNPYFAHDLPPPNTNVYIYKGSGRARASYKEMHLFLDGLPSESSLPPKTVAHEFGHVMGNPDEYALTPSEYQRITGTKGTQPPPRGGETVKGLMGSQYRSTAVEKRHAGAALDIVNAVRDAATYPSPFKLVKK